MNIKPVVKRISAAAIVPLILVGLAFASQVFADSSAVPTAPTVGRGTIDTLPKVPDLFKKLIGWLLVFAILGAVVAIIYGGIKYITAGGNSEKAGEGAKVVGYALVGVAIMVLAYALVSVVANLLGGDISQVTINP